MRTSAAAIFAILLTLPSGAMPVGLRIAVQGRAAARRAASGEIGPESPEIAPPPIIAPAPGDDPAPGDEPALDGFIEPEDITEPYSAPKTVRLYGAAYDMAGDVAAVVELKLGRLNPKTGKGRISGYVTGLDGRRRAIKPFRLENAWGDAPAEAALEVRDSSVAMRVTIGGTRFAGDFGALHVQSADAGGGWSGSGATFGVEFGDLSMFDGEVVSSLLPEEEPLQVVNGKFKAAKAALIRYAKARGGDEYALTGADDPSRPNLSALRISFLPKKGTFKGSFKIYELQTVRGRKKLKKHNVKFSGIVAGSEGRGKATLKKPAAEWPVTIR
ncbi:MAG: hypothetical protein K6F50_07225 [Kiritimatiellae bacterium]|nr:hypothetical protein [Kiritimatiellia bacterium]